MTMRADDLSLKLILDINGLSSPYTSARNTLADILRWLSRIEIIGFYKI